MNGLPAASGLAFLIVIIVSVQFSLASDTATNEGKEEENQIYIKDVDFSGLPFVVVHIGNVSCSSTLYGYFVALQMFSYNDEDRFEFYANVICPSIGGASSVNISVLIDNDDLTYFPEKSEDFIYIEYAVAYAWLAEYRVQGYVDSPQQSHKEFTFPHPLLRPKRSFSSDLYPRTLGSCEAEPEIFDVVKFPVVLENAGLQGAVVTFSNFSSLVLQSEFSKKPQMSVLVTLFLHRYCLSKSTNYCSIFHAVKGNDDENTPQLFLMRYTNELILQVVDAESNGLISYKSGLFLAPGLVHQVLVSVDYWYYNLAVSSWDPRKPPSTSSAGFFEGSFDSRVHLTSGSWPGYFIFGGSEYFKSFSGFIDSATVFRRRFAFSTDSAVVSRKKLSPIGQYLALRFSYCDDVRNAALNCPALNPFTLSKGRHDFNLNSITELLDKKNFSEAIYSNALAILEESASNSSIHVALDRLSLAGCLGSSSAEFLLGVVRRMKFSNKNQTDSEPPVVNYLKASKDGEHLADLALGTLLLTGSKKEAIPRDHVVAFRYLKAAADVSQQATASHSSSDRWVDSVHLDNEEELASHHGTDDAPVIAWLLYQAGMGDADAAHDVARLFYLGARGVDRDMGRAADLFRQAAGADADPEVLYDYAIVLLHGRGVEADRQKALELLHRAAEAGYGPAYGAIGWHYMEKDGGNLTLAVPYLEKAAELGVPEAAHNIGFLLLNNMHPFNPGKHPGLAYGYFVKAAGLGSLEGALMAAEFVARGIPSIDLKPNIVEACKYAHTVANQSPRLAAPLHSAIVAYVDGQISKSFLHYAIAAETGSDVAIFNAGYLCETEAKSLVQNGLISGNEQTHFCVKSRYQSVLTLPFATSTPPNRIYLWLAHEAVDLGNYDSAAHFYADALLGGSDEGYYGLAWLAAVEGYHIPIEVFQKLIISQDKSLAHSLVEMDPIDVAIFLLDACMTIEEKEKSSSSSYDEDAFDEDSKSLPEGYFSCALFSFYIKANQSLASTFSQIPFLSNFFPANSKSSIRSPQTPASTADDELAAALSSGSLDSLLTSFSNLFSFHSQTSVIIFFVVGFAIGVFVIYPVFMFIASCLRRLFRS